NRHSTGEQEQKKRERDGDLQLRAHGGPPSSWRAPAHCRRRLKASASWKRTAPPHRPALQFAVSRAASPDTSEPDHRTGTRRSGMESVATTAAHRTGETADQK